MDKFKDKLKNNISHPTGGNKEDIKISYQIKIVKVTGLAKSSYSPLLISWKRGSKKENTGELKTIPRDGEAAIDHILNINATITKTPKGFLEKTILFTVKEEKIGKKPNVLGTISVNLAQYAESKTEKTHPFPIQDKSKVVCNLYLSIQSSWLRVNGKSLVKAEGNQKEILQELGKQKISHEGQDFFLQTEQDMSEPDQTDFGDGHDSGDEEDHVDFDDDSTIDKSNVSTLSRKSSTSSIDSNNNIHTVNSAGGSGSQTPLSTISENATTNTTTTTTTASPIKKLEDLNETSEKDLTLQAANMKIKKYKKQLKQLTSELEKTKSACNGLTKDRDDKVEEIKKMLDDMETIKDRSKSVGNGVIADYTKQIEQLNKDNENLKIQLQRERNQSSQDSNQVTVLQNQLITVNSQLNTIRNENTQLNGTIRNLESQLRESSSNKPEELQNALATVQNLHLELNQLRGQIAQTTEENRNQFIQLEQERLKSNSSESNINRIEQEKLNLQQRLEHYERTIHLQLEDFEKEKLKISTEVGELKQKLIQYEQMEQELNQLKKDQKDHSESSQSSFEMKERELNDEIVQLKDRITAKELLFKETEDQLEDKSIQLEEKNNEISKLKEQLESLNSSNNNDKQQGQEELNELKEKLESKENEIIKLTKEIKSTELIITENQEYLSQINQLKSTIDSLELKLNQVQSDGNEEMTGEISRLKQELLEKDQDLLSQKELTVLYENEKNQLAKEFEDLQIKLQDYEKLTNDQDELKTKLEKLKNKKNTYKVLCQNQKVQLDNLEEQKREKEKESEETQEKGALLNEEFEELKSKLANESHKLTIQQEENQELKSQVNSYQLESISKQKLIDEYQEIISQLENDVNNKKQENEKLNQDLIEAKESINNRKDGDNDNKSDSSSQSDSNEMIEEFKEKIQYQKEKIKALKEDLEQKQDEWIDIKVKMEELIQNKDEEIERLQQQGNNDNSSSEEIERLVNENEKLKQQLKQQQSIPVPVPINNNNNEELIKEIENHKLNLRNYESLLNEEKSIVKKLTNELNELNERNEEISQELNDLRITVEQSRQSIPSSPMSARSMTSTATGVAEVEDIKKEMEENKIIEQSIYWSELDFDRNQVSHCGNNVWQMIDSIGGLSDPKNQRILNKIVTALEKSFLRSGNDCKFITYWFSTVSYLLYKINQGGYTQEQANPLKNGIEINVNSFVTPAPEIGGSFIRDLQSLNLSIYSKLLQVTEMKLEKVLIPSVFLPDSIILEAQKSPITKNSISSPSSNKSGGSGSSANSINNLLSILDGVIIFLKEGRIFDSISNQFLNQIFYFMNAQITNYLLSNSKVCTTTQGLEVKMGVSRLKEWCSQTSFKSASNQLDSSHEASNLLVIDKNVFVDIDAIKSIFQKLNLHQIKQLLESFTPDSLSPDPLPMVLKKALESNWRQTFDINSLPLLIDSTKKFKLNQ